MHKIGIFVVLLMIALPLIPSPVNASPSLSVGHYGGKGLNPEVSPGESYTWTLAASIGDTALETDVSIEVLGYGDSPQGDTQPLLPEEDDSPYSARSFIQPNNITLHIKPGEMAKTEVTVNIPDDVGSGGRYAILRFSTVPKTGGTVSVISVINLPMKFTIKDSQLIHQGTILEVTNNPTVSGQPVEINTVFQNTGNHHYMIQGVTEIRNSQNKLIDTVHTNSLSPVPTRSKSIMTIYVPKIELAQGEYIFNTKLMLEDSTVLDETNGRFIIEEPYIPPAAPANIFLKPGSSGKLNTTDNRISIDFLQGSVLSEVEVSLRNYSSTQLPLIPSNYILANTCFRVDGLSGLLAKDATVTVKYSDADLNKAEGNASKLVLARWDEVDNQWTILDTTLDKGARSLTANTNRFSIWAILVNSSGPSTTRTTIGTSHKTNWGLIGGIAGGIVIIAIGIYLLGFRRLKKHS
jgi:hypothetical protein